MSQMTADSVASPSGETELIAVRGVTKLFRHRGRTVEALHDIDLSIRCGEFLSLLGPSGCGKSTLLRVIGGLHTADRGSVTVGGSSADMARAGKQFVQRARSAPCGASWRTRPERPLRRPRASRPGRGLRGLREIV